MKKGFADFFNEMDADFFCIQESKMQEDQKSFAFEGYYEYWNDADKKGYSGTVIYTKHQPLSVRLGLLDGAYNDEGRIITLEYENFFLINTYVPNVKRDVSRLGYRMVYEDRVRDYMTELDKIKPVILCGDLNVAHNEIDLKNDKTNHGNAGFTDEERGKMTELLNAGFIDTFRYIYPNKEQYSWWSYMFNSRQNNTGWRIDYFIISDSIKQHIEQVDIYDQVLGSDHCPVLLELKI